MTIRALIEAVDRGEWTVTHWLDFEAVPNSGGDTPGPILAHRAYHGSLDAALALHEALVPGWNYCIHSTVTRLDHDEHGEVLGFSTSPARAWLLAILRAVEAEGQQ